ncbi:hypothetical protein ASE66_26920 [Bosea sp. Root483D1]|uniref:hypothetical protein n=1 Tax=Bosea sp. Root483D1 TaxID=1736544 RepID=UPI000708A96C|nr:hypothetical protein [Bosea sp. Root483D1]KRE22081.1 hypothetical protein ASE66_26920 [Bosea sp. Root483D1]
MNSGRSDEHPHVDLTPPHRVAENAGKGLRLEFNRGGTETIECMVSYFARHAVDKQAKSFDDGKEPSAGYIAWLLWGGGEGRDWTRRKKAEITGEDERKRA